MEGDASEFSVEEGRLDLHVDFPRGSRFACAECGGEGAGFTTRKPRRGGIWTSSSIARSCTLDAAGELSEVRGAQGRRAVGSGRIRVHVVFEAFVLALAKAMPIANMAERMGEHERGCGGSSTITCGARWRRRTV